MTTATIREKLHNYIRFADDKKVKAIYTILEEEIAAKYKWYEDETFIEELNRRGADYGSGKDMGRSLQEVEESLQKLKEKRHAVK